MDSIRECSFEGCSRKHFANNYCSTHAAQLYTRGFVTPIGWRPPRESCLFPGCGRNRSGRGLCSGHYQQQRKGNPLSALRQKMSIEERLAAYTDKLCPSGCWMWGGPRGVTGYGRISIGGQNVPAHRVVYEHFRGTIADGMVIDHKCHTPLCVNPQHLQVVTVKQNGENRAGPDVGSVSGVRGVSWSKEKTKWRARVTSSGREHHVGYFDSLAAAESVVVKKRNELFTNNLIDRGMRPADLAELEGTEVIPPEWIRRRF